MSDFEFDPEKALWTPRRGFLSLFGCAVAAAFLPSLPMAPVPKAAVGWGDNCLKVGDTFTMAGVFVVNPITFSTGDLEQFVVTGIEGSVVRIDRAMTGWSSAGVMTVKEKKRFRSRYGV